MTEKGVEIFEYSGIKANPVIEDVNKAVKFGFEKKVDCVIGLGGGSVIDTAKVVSMCIPDNIDGWEVMKGKTNPLKTLPLISVLTLAATGTEMNRFAVVQNPETKEKIGFADERMYPVHSFLDPSFTISVNQEHTAYGIVDLISHALENYFGTGDAELSDHFVFSVVKEAIEIAPQLDENPNNYDLRARMMWASTNALNGNTFYGRKMPDFGVHAIGHTLSLLFDTPHGASLSIVYPAWLKFLKNELEGRIILLGKEVFGTETVDDFISELSLFFKSTGSPVRLQEAGIGIDKREEILSLWKDKMPAGNVFKFTKEDYELLIDYMYDISEE